MRLIVNKALNNKNEIVNLKIIELLSTDINNNSIDYFSLKYQIPLIKFTDTGEVFNIRNFKNRFDLSLTETELVLVLGDLEIISGGGTIKIPNAPTYASNAAAITGGLTVGAVYKTATGELRIVV